MNSREQLFDLSYLNQVFQGNRVLIDEIIDLFLKQVPEYVKEMQSCVANNELHTLHTLAHKAKSSISMLGIQRMEESVLRIEINSKQKVETESLPDLVEALSKESEVVFEQLAAHLKKK